MDTISPRKNAKYLKKMTTLKESLEENDVLEDDLNDDMDAKKKYNKMMTEKSEDFS
jgi:hypothetical protein